MTERGAMWLSMQVSIHVRTMYTCISMYLQNFLFGGKVYRRPCIPKSGQKSFLKWFEFKNCWKAALFMCPDERDSVVYLLFTCCLLLFTCQVVQ